MDKWNLGSLADPLKYQNPVNVNTLDTTILIKQLEAMIRIRAAERTLANGRRDGIIGGPVHLSIGQEAIAVGIAEELRKTDRVFGGHRSHAHILSLGSNVRKLFAEVLGKDTGLSRGMGGSMHLWDQPNGFYGAVPIVAGTISLAVGASMAAKFQGQGDIGVAYLGDGAVEEGVFHESLNLARVTQAPTLFVVENNLFASHMHISLRQPKEATARFAEANDIPYEIVDGNDIVAVQVAAKKLINKIREGGGPGLIEAVTHRWCGHVDWRDDIDVGVKRSLEDITEWRKRDPIARLISGLQLSGAIDSNCASDMESRITKDINKAWEQAKEDPYPELASLHNRVYA